jgi:hypothetical protein
MHAAASISAVTAPARIASAASTTLIQFNCTSAIGYLP